MEYFPMSEKRLIMMIERINETIDDKSILDEEKTLKLTRIVDKAMPSLNDEHKQFCEKLKIIWIANKAFRF